MNTNWTIVIAASAMAAAVAVMILRKQEDQQAELDERRGSAVSLPILIICGDCCGEFKEPRRTCMDVFGRCSTCGGTSYVLAISVISHRAWSNQFPFGPLQQVPGRLQRPGAKVLPFDTQSLPARKIAV